MTNEQRTKFFRDYLNGIAADLEEVVERIPDTWDGFELRKLVADRLNAQVSIETVNNKKRYKAYNAVVKKNDLL